MAQGSGRTLVDPDVASRHGFKVVAFFVSFGGLRGHRKTTIDDTTGHGAPRQTSASLQLSL